MELPSEIVKMLEIISLENSHIKILRTAKKLYNIDENELKILTPDSVLQHLTKMVGSNDQLLPTTNFHSPYHLSPQDHWQPNEFKLFSWVSVCYSSVIGRDLSSFKDEDITLIKNLFSKKNGLFIEYHLLCLLRNTRSRKQTWQPEEVELLLNIISDVNLAGRWSDISYALFCRSGKRFFRTSHKCRQKWFNHLNPTVNHEKWSPQEDCELFTLAAKLGTKWAKISKAMQGKRTEHMVKNRYNSLAKKYQSRFQRCSTKKMIENIGKYLQSKLSLKKDEVHYLPIPNAPTVIHQPILMEQSNKEEDFSSFSKTIVAEREQCVYQSQYNMNYEAKTNQKLIKAEELDYVSNYDVMDLQFLYEQRNIELIDYISMEFQYKKTIFNCE